MRFENVISSLLTKGYSIDSRNFDEMLFVKDLPDGSSIETIVYEDEVFEQYFDENGEFKGCNSIKLKVGD